MEFNEASAQATLRKVAHKSQQIVDGDFEGTSAEAAETMVKLHADAKSASDYLAAMRTARELAEFGSAEPRASVEVKSLPVRSLGEAVIRSDAYTQAKSRVGSAASFHASFETKANEHVEGTLGASAPYTTDILSGTTGGKLITPNFLPGIVDIRQRPLVVADLMAQGTTDLPVIVYMVETSRSYGVDATPAGNLNVSELGAIPRSVHSFDRVNEPVVKIAHHEKVANEMMEDSSQLMSFLDASLIQGVRLREQQQLLNGTGTLPQLQGLLNRTGLQTAIEVSGGPVGAFTAAQAQELMEAIHTQISNIRFNAFAEPDAVLVNPTDWNTLRMAKDANDQYFAGGPFTAAYGNSPYTNVQSLWGFRVVVTPEIAAGTVLVGAFSEALILRRSGIRVEMTNADGNDFVNDIVTVRAEERLGLVVRRPGVFGKVTNAAV